MPQKLANYVTKTSSLAGSLTVKESITQKIHNS